MYLCAVSGQEIGFAFISALSGTPLTGLSGLCSGYKTTGSGKQMGLSGYIVETAFGQYWAKLFDWDVSGAIVSYYFTGASGAIPVEKTVVTTFNISGNIWPASGVNVLVPPASLSGVVANSGLNVTVPIASISGVVANSGLNVTVPIATLSGVVANSGLFVSVPTATLSGTTVTANVTLWQGVSPNSLISSGRLDAAFNVHTGLARSGTSTTIQLDNTVPTGISGVYDNAVLTIVGGTGTGRSRTIQNMGSSGIATVFPAWDASGVPDTTSIFTITPGSQTFSGQVYPASGVNSFVPIASISGTNVIVPISTISGLTANSGLFVSVPIASISGINSVVPIASISGTNAVVPISTLSGVVANSGLYVTVLPANLSGVVANSGLFVNATASVASGSLYLASGSIFMNTFASGVVGGGSGNIPSAWGGSGAVTVGQNLVSGSYVTVPISSISGVTANSGLFVNATASVASGSLYLASGSIFMNTFASGVVGGGSGNIPSSWGASGAVTVGQNLASGTYVTVPIASISGVVANSGLFVNATASVASGSLYLASGSIFINTFASGAIGGGSGNIPSSWGGSGAVTVGQNLDKTGYSVSTISSGILSGQQVTLVSGQSFVASGINTVVPIASISGNSSVVPISTLSGVTVNSGLFVTVPIATLSGTVVNSGLFVNIPIATISGTTVSIPISVLSGIVANSGLYVTVPISTISGLTANSGLSVSVPIASISGTNVVVPPSTLSGVVANSGLFVNATANVPSGSVYLASGSIFTNTYASGSLSVDIPSYFLKVNMSGVSGAAVHCPGNAFRKLTNRWDTTSNSGYLTVYAEDAATIQYTQALTSQSGAAPVTALGDA